MGLLLYDKPFKTINEQIQLLRDKHKLIINNDAFAQSALLNTSYYDLINGYKEYTMQDDIFKPGISIEYLYYLHLFDKNFQNAILKQSIIIENSFKTILSYVLAENFGVDTEEYLNHKMFLSSLKAIKFFKVKEAFEKIFKRYSKNDDKYYERKLEDIPQPTRHYIENHNHVPPWIILRNVSFSNSINLYRLTKDHEKHQISNMLLPNPNIAMADKINFLIAALGLIRETRNVIAHNLKFVTFSSKYNRLPKKSMNIITKDSSFTKNRNELNDTYACIIAIMILLNDSTMKQAFANDLLSCICLSPNNLEPNPLWQDYSLITNLPLKLPFQLIKLANVDVLPRPLGLNFEEIKYNQINNDGNEDASA